MGLCNKDKGAEDLEYLMLRTVRESIRNCHLNRLGDGITVLSLGQMSVGSAMVKHQIPSCIQFWALVSVVALI